MKKLFRSLGRSSVWMGDSPFFSACVLGAGFLLAAEVSFAAEVGSTSSVLDPQSPSTNGTDAELMATAERNGAEEQNGAEERNGAEDPRGAAGRYFGQLDLFESSAPHFPVPLGKDDFAGARFRIDREFSMISVQCPSYGNGIGSLTLSLYRWNGSVEATRTQKPEVRATFTDFPDNAALQLEFEPLSGGEFYWELNGAEERVGVWMVPAAHDGVVSFLNGEEKPGAYEMRVGSACFPIPFSGSSVLYSKLSAPPLSPSETDRVSAEDGTLSESRFAERDLFADTWDAIDGLGRILGNSETLGTPRTKQVGIFYWTWHEGPGVDIVPSNNAEILAKNPGIADRPFDPAWGKCGPRHHWDKPLFGFYRTTDAWVSRRHAQMLSAAGVDAVIFDATNGTHTWMDSTWTLLETWASMRRDGFRTPKCAFMLPFWRQKHLRDSLLQLYRDIYRPGKFRDLWFYWEGRPLVHADPWVIEQALQDETASPEDRKDWEEILRFFTFRPLQPAYARGPGAPDQWCWLEVFPQHGYVQRNDGSLEMCVAGVAQNHSWGAGDGHTGLAAMNDQNIFGRAYVGPSEEELLPGERLHFAPDRNPKKDEPNRFLWGENFAQQLDRAQELDPDYLFITGWNEWTAGFFEEWMGKKRAFPDQYSPEFSRDLEPSSGILQDHFYFQLVQGIRRFRGVRPQRAADEEPIYRDAIRDTLPRNAAGYGSIRCENATGRNDIADCSVSHDSETLTFRVSCTESLTPFTDPGWMRLFLSVSLDGKMPHWNHFQYIVNRVSPDGKSAVLEICLQNGWNWREVGRVPMRVDGKTLEVKIPRHMLGLNDRKIDLRFKWADNSAGNGEDGEILDFYLNGDAAPDGRFLYRYFER